MGEKHLEMHLTELAGKDTIFIRMSRFMSDKNGPDIGKSVERKKGNA